MFGAIMPSRISELINAMGGLDTTGVLLIGKNQFSQLYPVGYTDDLGSYMLIPPLARFINWDVISTAYFIYTAVIILSAITWLAGVKKLFDLHALSVPKLAIIFSLILFVIIAIRSDIYVFNAVSISFIPWAYVWINKSRQIKPLMFLYILFIGIVIGGSQYFRANSGTTFTIFLFVQSFLRLKTKQYKNILTVWIIFTLGYIAPKILVQQLIMERNTFLISNNISSPDNLLGGHPFWHTAYIGLGYIPNPYQLKYDDGIAIEKVKSIAPQARFCSPLYESILKEAYFNFIAQYPLYAFKVYGIKLLLLLLIGVILFLFIGGKMAILNNLVFWPMLAVLCFTLLPPIIAVPRFNYSSAFLLCILTYGLLQRLLINRSFSQR